MGIIKNIEDFKKIKLFRAVVNSWYIFGEDETYLELVIQPFDFTDAEFNEDNLLEFSEDDIFGKTSEEFLSWLMEKAEEEGYALEAILEGDFSVSQDNYLLEKRFDEAKKELVSEKLLENTSWHSWHLDHELDEAYFTSYEDAKQYLMEGYPHFNIDD